MKIEIEQSPYGDTGAVYEGLLGMTNHWLLQLKHFAKQPKTAEQRAFIENDIKGYEEILKSKSEKNARKFMELKDKRRHLHGPDYTNIHIVNEIKVAGQWE